MMFDGSSLPLGDNLRLASDLLSEAAAAAVVLEIECGVVGGEEDGLRGDDAASERLYTTTEDLLRVADALGTGERGRYLLAATFGNVHGLYAPGRREAANRDPRRGTARAGRRPSRRSLPVPLPRQGTTT